MSYRRVPGPAVCAYLVVCPPGNPDVLVCRLWHMPVGNMSLTVSHGMPAAFAKVRIIAEFPVIGGADSALRMSFTEMVWPLCRDFTRSAFATTGSRAVREMQVDGFLVERDKESSDTAGVCSDGFVCRTYQGKIVSSPDEGWVIDRDIDKIAEMVEQLGDYRTGIVDPVPLPCRPRARIVLS